MSSNITGGLTIAVLALALVLGGLAAGLALSGHGPIGGSATTTTTTTNIANATQNSPYVITLVIATNSIFNSTAADQPAFFLLGPHGLESAANISIPAHRLIELVIVNYDDGNATLLQQSANVVSGTKGNSILVASNDNINSTQGATGIIVRGGENVSSVPPGRIAHTFTVPSLNLNVPIPLSSTVVTYFTADRVGSYMWFCMTECGVAAMSTPGWMTGSLTATR